MKFVGVDEFVKLWIQLLVRRLWDIHKISQVIRRACIQTALPAVDDGDLPDV